MREWFWRHRLVSVLAAVVLANVAGLAVYRASGTPWPIALFNTVINVLLFAGVTYFYWRQDRNRRDALNKQGTLVYLRYPGAPEGSLQDRWAGGTAAVQARQILFQEIMSGTDAPLGQPAKLEVLGSAGPPRPPSRGGSHLLPPGLRVLTLTLHQGTVEIAADPADLARLEQLVLQGGPAS